MDSSEEYNSPLETGVGDAPHPGPDGKFAVLLTIGSREGDHRQQLHQNVEDCEKSRRDMLDDSINFVIYCYYRT